MPYEVRSGIEHLQIQHAVDLHLHVVARDADLRRDIERRFLQRVPVADDVDKRHQDVKSGVEHAGIPAQPFDDERTLLRHDDRGLPQHDDHDEREHGKENQSAFHERSFRLSGQPVFGAVDLFGDDRQGESIHAGHAGALSGNEPDGAGVASAHIEPRTSTRPTTPGDIGSWTAATRRSTCPRSKTAASARMRAAGRGTAAGRRRTASRRSTARAETLDYAQRGEGANRQRAEPEEMMKSRLG